MVLERMVEGLIRREKLLPPNVTVVIGVSGGADSLALLHIFTQLQKPLALRVIAATLDHGLRGDAGAADVAFVVETATAWGVEVYSDRADVPALAAEWKLSIEAAARRARYDFFAHVASATQSRYVFTAHNADDQAETVLMRLLRGAGLNGLAGMRLTASAPYYPYLILIRPLLTTTRMEIETYCALHQLQYRTDETNTDTRYLRNRMRHEVIPSLRAINPNISHTLRQTADLVRADSDYLSAATSEFISNNAIWIGDRAQINLDVFRSAHLAIQRRVLRRVVDPLQTDLNVQLSAQAVQRALNLILTNETGAIALLGDGWRVRIDYDDIIIEHKDDDSAISEPLLNEGETVIVQVPGSMPFGNRWMIHAASQPIALSRSWGYCVVSLPVDSTVQLRGRGEGDEFTPLGMDGHHKRLSAWMVDRKVPEAIRQRVPLLIVNGHIAAILYGTGAWRLWVIDERFKVNPKSTNVHYFWLTHLS